MTDQQIQIAAYPVGGGIFWLECSLCGPILLVTHDTCTPASVEHLNEHGCQIETPT